MKRGTEMEIGKRIRQARKNAGLTQEELAGIIHVTAQTIGSWERGDNYPAFEKIKETAKALHIQEGQLTGENKDIPDWAIEDEIFSTERMSARLKTAAETEHLPQTGKALDYAGIKFEGKFRDAGRFTEKRVPAMFHPLLMACHAHAMGICSDSVLAVILLHDVCEDCGVLPEDLPFDGDIKHSVDLLTKDRRQGETKEEAAERYYQEISADSTASIVKVIDRCSNVSLMALAFDRQRLIRYVTETQEYVMPLLKNIKEDGKYSDAAFLLKYQLRSSLETIKALLMT